MELTPEVLNIDCMEAMKKFPDKFFELAIVDPPYGIGMDGGNIGKSKLHKRKNWDDEIPSESFFNELFRVSKSQIIWGGNYMCHYLPITGAWIYWDKMQDGFGKTFSTGELAWTSFGSTMKQVRYKWQGNYCGFDGQITTKNSNSMQNIHPTQKPIALYKWLLKNYAKEGDKILDTHLGSGSSRIAAHDMGFDFWGYEIDKDYFEAQEKRFNQYISQLTLSL